MPSTSPCVILTGGVYHGTVVNQVVVARPCRILYCNLSIHVKYLSHIGVFRICCKFREKFTHFTERFLPHFQLLYAVVTRLDFRKFISSLGVKLPLLRRSRVINICLGVGSPPTIGYQSWYFLMLHPLLALYFGIQ